MRTALGSAGHFIIMALTKRIQFPKSRLQEPWHTEDDTFRVFRHAIVPGDEDPEAIFRVRFHVATMSPKANQRFSVVPIPFFCGLPGFRGKLWMTGENTGDMLGLYAWQTLENAKNYSQSFAARFMVRRSTPGSVSMSILTLTDLSAPSPMVAEAKDLTAGQAWELQ